MLGSAYWIYLHRNEKELLVPLYEELLEKEALENKAKLEASGADVVGIQKKSGKSIVIQCKYSEKIVFPTT